MNTLKDIVTMATIKIEDTSLTMATMELLCFLWQQWGYYGCHGYHGIHKDTLVTKKTWRYFGFHDNHKDTMVPMATMGLLGLLSNHQWEYFLIIWLLLKLWRYVSCYGHHGSHKVTLVTMANMRIHDNNRDTLVATSTMETMGILSLL